MKILDKFYLQIEDLKNIYFERIRKLREKNSVDAESKLRKIESMYSRGKDTTLAKKKFLKFLKEWENRKNHHLEMLAIRTKKLEKKCSLLLIGKMKKISFAGVNRNEKNN